MVTKNMVENKKEFNLSEKMFCPYEEGNKTRVINIEDVKEFIRLLKKDKCYCGAGEECVHIKTIDKLAGDKL